MVLYGHARKGFEYPLIKFAVITESDIFGQEQKKKKKKKRGGWFLFFCNYLIINKKIKNI